MYKIADSRLSLTKLQPAIYPQDALFQEERVARWPLRIRIENNAVDDVSLSENPA